MADFGGILERVRWRSVPPLAAALALGMLTVTLLEMSARPLALLVLAIAVAEALKPLVDWLEPKVRRRAVAASLVFLALTAVLALLIWAVAPGLVDQFEALVRSLPQLAEELQGLLQRSGLADHLDGEAIAGPVAGSIGSFALSIPTRILSAVVDGIVVAFLALYWLIGSRDIRRFALSLVPAEKRERAASVTAEMGDAMGGYVRGVVINSLIMGVLAWVGLMLIGVRYPLMLGLLTAMGEAVPVFGPIVVGAIVTLLALLQSVTKAIIALIFFTALTQIEGQVLTPNIMRSQTEVPQTLVLFAILVGAALGGVLGILVAIPIAAAVRVAVLRLAPRDEGTSEAAG